MRRKRPVFRLRYVVGLLMVLGLTLALVRPVLAVHTLGLFELDGNVADDAAPGDDWANVYVGTDSAVNGIVVQDQLVADLIYGTAAKDGEDLSGWDWTTATGGATPNKNNLLNAGVALYTNPANGNDIVYFFSDRFATAGDASAGFWLFKGYHALVPSAGDPTKGTFEGLHTVGDILVYSEFTGGGRVSTVQVYKWVGGADPLLLQATGADCRNDDGTPAPSGTVCATVNRSTDGTVDPPWPYTDAGGASAYPTNAFFEGGFDATALGLDIGCGGTFMANSRASQSITANLHDFVMGDFALCAAEVSTQVHDSAHVDKTNSSVPLGSIVHDTATVSKTATTPASAPGPDTTGDKVSFTFYANGGCTGDGTAVARESTPGGSDTIASNETVALAAGSYSYKAHYAGDTNYPAADGPCEPFTVNKGTLTLVTTVHDASHAVVANAGHVPLGSVMHDNANLTGAVSGFTPTGAITFTFSGGALGAPPAPEAGFYATSGATSALGAQVGAYSFSAAYAGDSNYNAIVAGTHNPETFFVDKGTSTLVTELHKVAAGDPVIAIGGSAVAGTSVHDSATVTVTPSFAAPTGSVEFRFYTSLAACTADTGFSGGATKGTVALNGANPGVSHPSDAAGPLAVGEYAFKAKWAGDSNYTGSISSCEDFTIIEITSDVSTEMHNSDHTAIAEGGAAKTEMVHDKALLNNAVADPAPSGSFTFRFYGTWAACEADTAFASGTLLGDVAVNASGVADPSVSVNASALGAGSYAFRAKYDVAGTDPNYSTAMAACEKFTVSKVKVIKTETVGSQLATFQTQYSFRLTGGPDNVDITLNTTIGGAVPATLDFGVLRPGTYTLTELAVPAGTHSTLADLPGAVLDSGTGNVSLEFTLAAAEERVFNIDNSRPGGDARTIGYWKNWNTFSHDGNFGWDKAAKTGNHLLDEFLPITIGTLQVTSAEQAFYILDKTDNLSFKKMAGDAAYALAAQLLAAKANVEAGAGHSAAVDALIADADKLLGNGGLLSDGFNATNPAHFDGNDGYWKGGNQAVAAHRAEALKLAGLLDSYNNNLPVTYP